MPLSEVIPYPRDRQSEEIVVPQMLPGSHTHIYLDRARPENPPRRAPRLPAADRAVLRRIRDAKLLGAEPDPVKRQKPLAAKDQNEEEEQEPQIEGDPRVVAELPPPPAGQHYEVEARAEGVYAIVLTEGPQPGPYDLPGDSARDPRLRRMNDMAKKMWAGKTRDARFTLFRHFVTKGERLVLEGPDANGGYSLVLIDHDGEDLNANTPLGASGSGPTLRSPGAVPPESNRTGDKLRWMNAMARAKWARR